MMNSDTPMNLELKIENVSLAELPMDKIGLILRQLASLADQKKEVRLQSVADGCLSVTCRVEAAASLAVGLRLAEANRVDGGQARAAWQDLDETIASLGGTAGLRDTDHGNVILAFPGAEARRKALPPLWQFSTLRGRLTSLRLTADGPKGTIVNAGGRELFEATQAHAGEMRVALFEHVEISGRGYWEREDHGAWRLRRFQASGHRILRDDGLVALRAKLVSAGGFGAATPDQVRRELDAIR